MVYRRTSKISFDIFSLELNEIFSSIDVAHSIVYIMGDFNIDLLQFHRSSSVAAFGNNILSRG